MLLHADHAAHHGHHKILIQTVDTDVVVLAVSVAQGLVSEYELWLAFETGKHFRYLAAHKIGKWARTKEGTGTPDVSCTHRLSHCVQLYEF